MTCTCAHDYLTIDGPRIRDFDDLVGSISGDERIAVDLPPDQGPGDTRSVTLRRLGAILRGIETGDQGGITILTGGLARGGGPLTGNVTIAVNAATNDDVTQGTAADRVVTPSTLSFALGSYLKSSRRGVSNGVAPLDTNAKVPVANIPSLPASILGSGTIDPARLPAAGVIGNFKTPQNFGSVGTPNDASVISLALNADDAAGAHSGAMLTRDHTIASTLTVPGRSLAEPTKRNSTLIFGPAANLIMATGGSLVNKGFVVGIGANDDQFFGLWKQLDSRYIELYASALAGHACGNGNGIVGSVHQDGIAGFGFPCASIAYALQTDPGNAAFGFFGRTDARAAGVITHELNTFNFFGDPDDFSSGFPSRAGGISKANPVTLTLACGGNFRSTAAFAVTREGTPENTSSANYRVGGYFDGRFITDWGLIFDSDGQPGGSTYNNGHGAPDGLILGRMAPTSTNGIALQAVGYAADWTSVRTMLSIANNVVNPSGTPSSLAGNNLTVNSDGSVSFRWGSISPAGVATGLTLAGGGGSGGSSGGAGSFTTLAASGATTLGAGLNVTGAIGATGTITGSALSIGSGASSITGNLGIGGTLTSSGTIFGPGGSSLFNGSGGGSLNVSSYTSGSRSATTDFIPVYINGGLRYLQTFS